MDRTEERAYVALITELTKDQPKKQHPDSWVGVHVSFPPSDVPPQHLVVVYEDWDGLIHLECRWRDEVAA